MTNQYKNIPLELQRERAFVFWRTETNSKNKLLKIPVNPITLKDGGQTDPSAFITFSEALTLFDLEQTKPIGQQRFQGIGMVFPDESNLVGFDLDNITSPDGILKSHMKEILEGTEGFVEISMSGNGRHIITRTNEKLANLKNHDLGFEVFKGAGYFIALTGNEDKTYSATAFPNKSVDLSSIKPYLDVSRKAHQSRLDKFEIDSQRDPNLSLQEAREMVLSIQAPDAGRKFWLSIGMILHHQFRGDEEAKDVWIEYSQQDPEIFGEYAGDAEIDHQWRSFGRELSSAHTHASLRHYLKLHPKAKKLEETDFIELDYTTDITQATEFIIDGFIAEGIFMLAGAPGVGKSTLLVPLAATAAGLCADGAEINSALRRRVIYLTEDSRQVLRILFGLRKHHGVNLTDQQFKEWFRLIETKRTSKDELAALIRRLATQHTVKQQALDGSYIDVAPLIVADTVAATFDLDDENNNALVSSFVSEIKTACSETGVSFWAVAHLAKGSSRTDIEKATPRGASAFEGDVNGTAYVFDEGIPNTRHMILGKTRYTPEFREVNFECSLHSTSVQNRLGQKIEEFYRVGVAKKSSKENRLDQKDRKLEDTIEKDILSVIRANPAEWFTRETLKDATGCKSSSRAKIHKAIVDRLIKEDEIELEYMTKELRAHYGVGNSVAHILKAKKIDFDV